MTEKSIISMHTCKSSRQPRQRRGSFHTLPRILLVPLLSGGNSNIFYFHPYLGKRSNLTNIFQMGWNHQLVYILPTTCSFSLQKSTTPQCLVRPLSKIYKRYHSQTLGWDFLSPLPEVSDISFSLKRLQNAPTVRTSTATEIGVCQCEDHGAYGLLHWLLVDSQHPAVPERSWLGTMGDRRATWEDIKSFDARMIDFHPGALRIILWL